MTTFTEALTLNAAIGGGANPVFVGDAFEQVFDHVGRSGIPLDLTGVTPGDGIVFDPLDPSTTVATLTVALDAPLTEGKVRLSMATLPAAGEYHYRAKATEGGATRVLQHGRFTVGDTAP